MPERSAGLLLYRHGAQGVEVLLVHPGGPYFARRDLGAWTIPKGKIDEGEEPLQAAQREFREETGTSADGTFLPLNPVRQASGKIVYAWAVQGDCDTGILRSNTFDMEWPPHSGRSCTFPEIDRGEWFSLSEARQRINKAQSSFLDQLEKILQR